MTKTDLAELLLGTVLDGKYELVRYVAGGGMGAVYEARHTAIGRRFAVKLLRPDMVRRKGLLERFCREAQAAGALENENIAAVTDFGDVDGAPYLVMEYLSGQTLEALLHDLGPLPVPRAADLLQQTCYGLQDAHDHGIVHRDLKPANLFVCSRNDGTDLIKILDFGIAKLRPSSADQRRDVQLTDTGTMMGTPHYMPPEQARGERDLDHRADIYALGVILYQILSGQLPHPGKTYNEILFHILTQKARPLSSLREGLPEGLATLVHQCLDPAPERRPGCARQIARELEDFSGRRRDSFAASLPGEVDGASAETEAQLPAAEPTSARSADPAENPTDAALSTDRLAADPHRSRRALAVALALVAVAAVAVIWGAGSTPDPAEPSAQPATESPTAPAGDAPPVTAAAAEPPPAPTRPAPSLPPASASAPPVSDTTAPPAPKATAARPPVRASSPPSPPVASTKPAASQASHYDHENPYGK